MCVNSLPLLAKLSEGQLIGGRLECLYHGWQFEGEGNCAMIPRLPANAKIPLSACVNLRGEGIPMSCVGIDISENTTKDLLDEENPCLLRDLEEQQGLKSQTGSPNGSFIRGAPGVRARYGIPSSQNQVAEYRKWMDRIGHEMPYHFEHNTISLPELPVVGVHAPAGLIAGASASFPA
ncbi:hypothetical protein POTOM_056770 [Populus tomentosa]|uniref:Rieske domain-containing protein n=1 Tax=Populus tomentosa TaxID=118781 RepID=A0A8X7XVW9_POPTO|nr:hypothetical protein POTOM_056770 [Populus tomentosa]